MHSTRSKRRAPEAKNALNNENSAGEKRRQSSRGRKLGVTTSVQDKQLEEWQEDTAVEDNTPAEVNKGDGSDHKNFDDHDEDDESSDDGDDQGDKEEGRQEENGEEEEEEDTGDEDDDEDAEGEVDDGAGSSSEDEDALLNAALLSVKAALKIEKTASEDEASSGSDSDSDAPCPQKRKRPLVAEEVAWRPHEGIQGGADGAAALDDTRPFRHKLPKGDAGGTPSLLASATVHKATVMPSLDERAIARQQRKLAPKTAGPKFFDMPAPTLTPELQQELRLLKLRGAMDPKRFYKAADSSKLPTFFQIGTVIEGPTEYYSSRLTKKQRKRTFTEELLAQGDARAYMKKKFLQIQKSKQAGGKGDYKEKMKKRKPWAAAK